MKRCKICQNAIDTALDNYSKLESFEGKKSLSKGYYHTACFFERIRAKNDQKTVMEKAMSLLTRAETKMDAVEI